MALEAVFHRRSEVLNAERLQQLEAVLARSHPPTLEDIIDAFTHPLLDRSERGGPGWKAFFALVAEVNNSPEWGNVLMTRHFDPLVQKFIEAIRRALPGCRGARPLLGLSFPVRRAHADLRRDRAIDRLSGGVCRSSDLDDVHVRLVPYCAAGFRAICKAADASGAAAGKRRSRRS